MLPVQSDSCIVQWLPVVFTLVTKEEVKLIVIHRDAILPLSPWLLQVITKAQLSIDR